jgi:hypothetical protein
MITFERLEEIVTKYGLELPHTARLINLRCEDLYQYLAFAFAGNKSLELFRNEIK